jgi:multiple sugar transport system permease protein/putative aldouronate transport system permease protein
MTFDAVLKRKSKNKIRVTGTDKIYLGIVYTFIGFFTVIVLYPLIYVLSCSFSSPEALVAGKVVLWPVDLSLMGYTTVFNTSQVWVGYRNSFIYTVTGTVLNVFVTMCAAYPLSRKEFKARSAITWFYSVTLFISGGLIPSYLLIRSLGMLDTMWALILPGTVSAWGIIICRTFLQGTIPNELFEAAIMDGCSYTNYFFRVVIPLSKAVMAVLALNYATGMWNSYFSALIYISSAGKFPLQLILQNILIANRLNLANMASVDAQRMIQNMYLGELLKYSLIVVASVPLMVFYPFIQKYFIKGALIGSVKG